MGWRDLPLDKGYVTRVDAEDYDWLSQWQWHVKVGRSNVYAARTVNLGGGRYHTVRMHRELMPGAPRVDHIDHDGLNNRRKNLRDATRSQNSANSRKPQRAATSQYKGVSWDGKRMEWVAQIMQNKRTHNLGRYQWEVSAAVAYDAGARRLFGEYAALNFPGVGERGLV